MKREEWLRAFPKMPETCFDAMMAAAYGVENEQKRKKRSPMVLVVVLAVMIVATVAFALGTWRDGGQEIVRMENQLGEYESWSAGDRVRLVKILVEIGEIQPDEHIETLITGGYDEMKAKNMATLALLDYMGTRHEMISFDTLLWRAWGPKYTWPLEDKVWYSDLRRSEGLLQPDEDIYLMPQAGDITEDAAIALTLRAYEDGLGLPPKALSIDTPSTNAVEVLGTDYFARAGKPDTRYWCIYLRGAQGLVEPHPFIRILIDAKTGKIETDIKPYDPMDRDPVEVINKFIHTN